MATTPAYEISLAEKVTLLKQPLTYPYPVDKIETRETHMSWVFLVNDHAYKLKKPVQYRFLDFRTIEAREYNCREEFRLNKRLAKDIYEGVVPLSVTHTGKIQVESNGQVIDWLVKMKRIRQENLLDYAILNKQVNPKLVENTANLLARFYKKATPVPVAPDYFRKKLTAEIISTQKELLHPLYHLPADTVNQISNQLVNFIKTHQLLFDERLDYGKIIEAHGDLKPEHICLAPKPAIIDALEFNRDLRVMDIAEELSFLAMECEMMGDLYTGKQFLARYKKITHDPIPESLICFYKSKKALLRCWLVARHITEPGYRDEPKWMKRANAYLQLAKKYRDKLVACGINL